MKRKTISLTCLVLLIFILICSMQLISASKKDVLAFYYIWYGNPDHGGWKHWNAKNPKCGTERIMPTDISANFFPLLDGDSINYWPYNSADTNTINTHMSWIKNAGVGVLILSWTPTQSKITINNVFAAANAQGLKICFLIEPYLGRTINTVIQNIKDIIDDYGSLPAFYKLQRNTKYSGNTDKPARGMFYIWASAEMGAAADWAAPLDSIRDTNYDAIVLDHIGTPWHENRLIAGHFDGQYTYGGKCGNISHVNYAEVVERDHNSIFSIGVAPGYDDRCDKDTGPCDGSNPQPISRRNGDRFREQWGNARNSLASLAGVVTFNEWHEGTQIEPATYLPPDRGNDECPYCLDDYSSYEGTMVGSDILTGKASENAYVMLTNLEAAKFISSRQRSLPIAPPLISPANGSWTGTHVVFSWQELETANPHVDKYQIQVRKDSNDVIVVDEQGLFISRDYSLPDNSKYKWRVRAHNEWGWGPYSEWSLNVGNTVSVDLGRTDVIDGLERPSPEPPDGLTINTVITDCNDRDISLRKNKGADFNSKYIYFKVNDQFIKNGSWKKVKVRIQYWDKKESGWSDSFMLQYDSTTEAYKHGKSITVGNTLCMKIVEITITDAYFGNRQNKGSDFRIWCGTGDTRRFLNVVKVIKLQ